MNYAKPLSVAAALALCLISMDALATTPNIDFTTNTTPQARGQAVYYIAEAGTPQAHKVYYFNKLDRNHDGQLSRSELPKDMHRLRAYFIYADWSKNGRLSPSEYLMWEHHTAPEYVGVYHVLTFVYDYH